MKYTIDYPSAPKATEFYAITNQLKAYHAALKAKQDWRSLYNEEAEIDLFILNDVFANADGYGNSKNVLYFLNENNNKIEPIAYDFVASLGVPMFSGINSSWNYLMTKPELIYTANNFQLLPYYKDDANFTHNLKARYMLLRQGLLSDAHILGIMQPIIDQLNNGKHYEKNQKRWTDLNAQRYSSDEFKQKLLNRLKFIDGKWKN
jgi:hypothetical protein